jgi:hypothetical protein
VNALVVLDLHGGLRALRQVRPFLYPLDGELCWLEPRDLRDVPEAVAAWLRRHGARSYRLIVLLGLDLPKGDPFAASLALGLFRLERHCLAPLRRARPAPATVHAVVLDGLERDAATGCPEAAEARPGWELDTRGMALESGSPLLLGADAPRRLAEAWGPPVDLSGERNDAGLEGLSPGLRADIQARLERVRGQLDDILEARLAAVREAYPDPGHDLRGLLEEGHAAIRRAAEAQRQGLERAVPKLAAFRPDAELRRLAAENLGLLPAIRGLGLMRLPWQPIHGRLEPEALLALVNLILLLARRPCRQEDVDRLLQDDTRAYTVAVRFDDSALARLFENWRGRLRHALRCLDQPARTAEPLRVRRYLDDVCRSTAAPPLPDSLDGHLKPWRTPWLRRPVRDLRWLEWLDGARERLAERRRAVDTHVDRLGEKLRPSAPPFETLEIDRLADERAARRAALDACKSTLAEPPPPAPDGLDRRTRQDSRQLLALLDLQPTLGETAAWLLAGLAFLAAAWAGGPAVPVAAFIGRDALLPGAAALLAVLAVAGPAWRLRTRIAGLSRQCREAALDIDRQLRGLAEHRCRQLERLCRLGVAARNLAETEQLDAERGRWARLAEHHRRQLAKHLDSLGGLAGPGSAEPPAGNGPAPLDPAQPPARNRAYWPVPNPPAGENVELAIGETRLKVEAPWVEGVEAFVLAPVALDAFGREP